MTTSFPRNNAPVEHGDPTLDGRAFRRALGQFATGVTVITTSHDDQLIGMTANSFSAVSLEPPLVLWSIRKESGSVDAFSHSGHFSINVLAENQIEASGLFARHNEDQLDQISWTPSRYGDPLLEGSVAQFECVTESVTEAGDHYILLGRVERFARFAGPPLLFAQGQYGSFGRHPELRAPSTSGSNTAESEDSLFFTLLRDADRHMSALFDEHRDQIGVTVGSGRILNRLVLGPRNLQALEEESFLGENAAESAVLELAEAGHIRQLPDGRWELTSTGSDQRTALRRSAEAFSEDQLRGIAPEDLAAAERVLRSLLGLPSPNQSATNA